MQPVVSEVFYCVPYPHWEHLGFYGRRTVYHTDGTDRNPFEVVIELKGTVAF